MKPDRWATIEALFLEAAERPAAERESFLAAACGDDTELVHEVTSLLEADAGAERLFQTTRLPQLTIPDESPDLSGVRLGHWQLLGEINRGGMGVVYRARRADSEFEKEVAVKVIKRGMDSDAILQRFRRERQILAGLEHPGIARLLDGGTTEDGLPFVVMEYIDGAPVDEYCQRRNLSIQQRIDLFLRVCAAVEYAHQRLVIHRDLKPGNILVTEDGEPRLLDFGIATVIDEGASSHGTTQATLQILTPGYASPEQVRGELATTATDVYSLGVVLYELLADVPPYRLGGRTPSEVERLICLEEPVRPSTAVLQADGLVETTRRRRSRRLRGDLDNIVMSTLRKDPARRYASVSALARDLENFLKHRPVAARPDSLGYRASKFLRRNRTAVVASLLVLLTLIGGLTATFWQWQRAERRFNDVRTLANSFLFELHDAIADLPGSTSARELLVRRALEYLDSLAAEARGDPALQAELASAYEKVGDVQGNPVVPNLGDTDGAQSSYRKALEIRLQLVADDPTSVEYRRDLSRAQYRLAEAVWWQGRTSEALALFRNCFDLRQGLIDEGVDDLELRRELAMTHSGLAMAYDWSGDVDRSVEHHGRASALIDTLLTETPGDEQLRRSRATLLMRFGDTVGWSGDWAAALERFREARSLYAEQAAEAPNSSRLQRDLWHAQWKIGESYVQLDQKAEALASYRKAHRLSLARADADPTDRQARRDVAVTEAGLGNALAALQLYEDAVASFENVERIHLTLLKEDSYNIELKRGISIALLEKAKALRKLTGYDEARRAHEKAVEVSEQVRDLDPDNAVIVTDLALAYEGLADLHDELSRLEDRPPGQRAESARLSCHWYRKSLEIYRQQQQDGTLAGTYSEKPQAVEAKSKARGC